ncbi:MAG: type II secretion system protein [Caldiserica bacterium]|nr:type II secretion system protein [Caldisericota bacterium]
MLFPPRLRPTRARREGFTLIELVVAMAIMVIVIYVALTTVTYALGMARRAQSRSEVQADLSAVIDQATKELRETTTQNDGVGGATCYGVTVPAPAVAFPATPTVAVIRHLNDLLATLSPVPPLVGAQEYIFDASRRLLEFYVYDVDPLDLTPATPSLPLVKHRIRYGLSIPAMGALARRYWPLAGYQPLQVTYANDYYNGTSWSSVTPEPVTGQVVTDFTVIRPAGSRGAIQLVIEASVASASGGGVSPIRMLAQVTVRQ